MGTIAHGKAAHQPAPVFSLEPVKNKAKGLAHLLTYGMGERCPVFLDTSAAIDLEKELACERSKHRSFAPVNFYFYLRDYLGGNLYVCDGVAKEAIDHSHHRIHGKQELSDETVNIMLLLNESHKKYAQASSFAVPLDEIRRDVYWASFLAFDPAHKKAREDCISHNDREIMAAALHSRYAVGSTGATIFSSDTHITETARVLVNNHSQAYGNLCKIVGIDPDNHLPEVNGYQPFTHTNLRAFSTRSDDHVYCR